VQVQVHRICIASHRSARPILETQWNPTGAVQPSPAQASHNRPLDGSEIERTGFYLPPHAIPIATHTRAKATQQRVKTEAKVRGPGASDGLGRTRMDPPRRRATPLIPVPRPARSKQAKRSTFRGTLNAGKVRRGRPGRHATINVIRVQSLERTWTGPGPGLGPVSASCPSNMKSRKVAVPGGSPTSPTLAWR
jgi:hypothetical protein